MLNFIDLKRRLRKDNPRWVILLIDISIVFFCYLFSNFIINSFKGSFELDLMLKKGVLIVLVYLFFFISYGTFRGIVRQTGIRDAIRVFKVIWLAMLTLMAANLGFRFFISEESILGDYLRMSYAVLFMHAFLSMVVLVAARIFYRTIYEAFFLRKRKQVNVLIFGASRPGLMALSLLRDDVRVKYSVFAFVEDKPSRVGKRLAGFKILGLDRLDKELIHEYNIEQIIIAVENNDPERLERISEKAQDLELEIRIMPPSNTMLNAGNQRQIRALKIEDLLGRKVIQLDNPAIQHEMYGKVILVTGAAGSIGSELARQISLQNYDQLILIDQAESAIYDVQQTLLATHPERVHYIVGNVRDRLFMEEIFAQFRPDLVFHAAAYKHVPLMEQNPYEAILTNVIGTRNVADMAVKYKTKKFVMVSTDKAINPTNVMGATKRAAEIYVNSCQQQQQTAFIVTRFGNVLGSNGSVIPLFERQMEAGGPLTLTHPDITRYFMTIPEACQLVQEAGVMGKGGEIFVFDMGKSVKIIELAKRMIRLKGYRYPEDIDIKITGLRPGEKIYEELLANNENTIRTHHEKIMIAKINSEDLNEKRILLEKLCAHILDRRSGVIKPIDLVRILKNIVPEFVSQNSIYEQLDSQPTVEINRE
ncbi:UDP-glucose 4-epimerase [Sphingobacterium spiritivorum]|uniref:Polysaccharide biosynthesis protein n=2 Tax=Sphingobacterium spiritivorum TaxID=258 RepID=D7VI62_SPHSI|nr:polysaccharide biosynthesis protein [Sphingobacterium spiritivorum ATCC 33861]QQT37590.1 polysaccharide biosynthesis protein [Sphingobacterium spiritivorum]SUI97329.1 UDP-glucose 4-epimerase [Sphingobacterium spiritivorum]